jgi:hypothetical protein
MEGLRITALDPGSDRRTSPDRRRLTWRSFLQGGLTPRRRGHRRHHESQSPIDWHEPHLLFLSIMILLLSVTDAFLTLTLMARGASEANPFLALILDHFPQLFAIVKMGLTGAGIVVLVALARSKVFRVIRISLIIHWCMLGYLALIVYEAWLVSLAV